MIKNKIKMIVSVLLMGAWMLINFEAGRVASEATILQTGNVGLMPILYVLAFIVNVQICYSAAEKIFKKWGD